MWLSCGELCGILTLLYSMFFFSIDHSWIYFEPINRDKLIVVLLGLIANICVIGHLQQRNKNAMREISKLEAEGKIAAARAQILHNMSHDIRTPSMGFWEWHTSLRAILRILQRCWKM